MVHYTNLKNVLTKVIKTTLRKKHDYFAKTYYSYLRILENEKNPDTYIRGLARRLIPNEDVYKERLEKYQWKYFDNDVYTSLEELYQIYYKIAETFKICPLGNNKAPNPEWSPPFVE